MCGVVGALGKRDLSKSVALLAHRGIRSTVLANNAGTIGHVRLPIVGLGTEHDQPMIRDNWLIGFVGELLDFKEMYPGYECDAEVVADKWKEMGPYFLSAHDGFWGVIAIDERLEVLHVLTDYLGQKPMYYRTDIPAAASEPNALLPFGPVDLDKVYLSACMKWGYCPDVSRTPYNEIKHALPGEHIILANGMFPRCRRVDTLPPLPYSVEDMREAIVTAVRRRVLSSDVPVAALVSGGIDSAIVYTLAKRYGKPVPYYAYDGNDGSATNDDEYWRAIIVVRGLYRITTTLPHLKQIAWTDVSLNEGIVVMQEPIDLGSLRPQIALAHGISESVCLTGDGADELFGGYSRSQRYDSQHSDVFQELPAWHMPRLDRAMMINRIEVRSPFLARDVVRMALSLPHGLRKDKVFLRGLFANDLPHGIAHAEKKALRTPEIAADREYYSKVLVDQFVEGFNGRR